MNHAKSHKKILSLPAQIERMVQRIVKEFHPEKIILFGSQARGDAGPGSDVDLLVVMPVEGSPWDKAVEIRVALDDIVVPTDVIVTTPEDFAWRKDVVGTIEWPAAREGKVLYVRAQKIPPWQSRSLRDTLCQFPAETGNDLFQPAQRF